MGNYWLFSCYGLTGSTEFGVRLGEPNGKGNKMRNQPNKAHVKYGTRRSEDLCYAVSIPFVNRKFLILSISLQLYRQI